MSKNPQIKAKSYIWLFSWLFLVTFWGDFWVSDFLKKSEILSDFLTFSQKARYNFTWVIFFTKSIFLIIIVFIDDICEKWYESFGKILDWCLRKMFDVFLQCIIKYFCGISFWGFTLKFQPLFTMCEHLVRKCIRKLFFKSSYKMLKSFKISIKNDLLETHVKLHLTFWE